MRITCFAALPRVFCFLVLLQVANSRPLEVSLLFWLFYSCMSVESMGLIWQCIAPHYVTCDIKSVTLYFPKWTASVAVHFPMQRLSIIIAASIGGKKTVTGIIISKMSTVWGVTIRESYGVCTLFERKHHIQQISCSPKSVMKTFFGLKLLFKESMWTILFNLCDTLHIAKVTVIQQC